MSSKPDLVLPETQRVALPDGRSLAYIEVGDPEGFPVISNHGGLSSRLDIVPADASAKAHGLRIISPDRPGIGQSDRKDGRSLLSWADDVAALTDALDVDRFATMGWSFGGTYAQVVAHRLAARVAALALVASTVPVDWDGMREGIDRMDQIFMKMSEKKVGQFTERTIFHLMHADVRHAPKAFAKQSGFPAGESALLTEAIGEGLSDVHGVVEDYKIHDIPWGFDPSDITVPTQIWQGDADELVPPEWGPRLRDAIPGSTLTLVPDGTHFLWYDHWDEIFSALAAAVDSPSTN